jgi:hypothetical protein
LAAIVRNQGELAAAFTTERCVEDYLVPASMILREELRR